MFNFNEFYYKLVTILYMNERFYYQAYTVICIRLLINWWRHLVFFSYKYARLVSSLPILLKCRPSEKITRVLVSSQLSSCCWRRHQRRCRLALEPRVPRVLLSSRQCVANSSPRVPSEMINYSPDDWLTWKHWMEKKPSRPVIAVAYGRYEFIYFKNSLQTIYKKLNIWLLIV